MSTCRLNDQHANETHEITSLTYTAALETVSVPHSHNLSPPDSYDSAAIALAPASSRYSQALQLNETHEGNCSSKRCRSSRIGESLYSAKESMSIDMSSSTASTESPASTQMRRKKKKSRRKSRSSACKLAQPPSQHRSKSPSSSSYSLSSSSSSASSSSALPSSSFPSSVDDRSFLRSLKGWSGPLLICGIFALTLSTFTPFLILRFFPSVFWYEQSVNMDAISAVGQIVDENHLLTPETVLLQQKQVENVQNVEKKPEGLARMPDASSLRNKRPSIRVITSKPQEANNTDTSVAVPKATANSSIIPPSSPALLPASIAPTLSSIWSSRQPISASLYSEGWEPWMPSYYVVPPSYQPICKSFLHDPPSQPFFSQFRQDWLIYHNYFKQYIFPTLPSTADNSSTTPAHSFSSLSTEPGFYIDIGSGPSLDWSNSLFFDVCLGWQGICVEPNPKYHADYETVRFETIRTKDSQKVIQRKSRNCNVIKKCIDRQAGQKSIKDEGEISKMRPIQRQEDVVIECISLDTLLDELELQYISQGKTLPYLHYVSLDAQDMESDILSGFSYRKTAGVWTISLGHNDGLISHYMKQHNYELILHTQSGQNLARSLFIDNVYMLTKDMIPITVQIDKDEQPAAKMPAYDFDADTVTFVGYK